VIEVDGGVNPNAFAVFMLMIGGFFRDTCNPPGVPPK